MVFKKDVAPNCLNSKVIIVEQAMKAMKAMKTAKLMSKGALATELAEAAELKKSDVSKVPWPADVVG